MTVSSTEPGEAARQDGVNSGAFLPVAVFLVSLVPFATVHPQERLALGFLAATVGAAGLFRGPERLDRVGLRLFLVATLAWAWEAVAFLPVGAATRARLQPGIAPAVTDALAAAGGSVHPLALSPWLALIAWALAGGLLLLAAGTARIIRDEQGARRMLAGLVGVGVAVVATAALHRWLHAPSIYWISGVPAFSRDPFFAPFVSPNHGGAASAALLPLAVALGLQGSRRRRILAGLGALVLAGGVGMSGSRAAWIDAGAAVLVLIALGGDKRVRQILAALLGLTGITVLLIGPGQVLMWLTASVTPALYDSIEAGYSDVLTGRGELYKDVVHLISATPWVGVGPGSFDDAYGLAKSTADFNHASHAHQEILQTWAEHGLLGLLLWGGVIGGLAITAVRRCARAAPGERRQLWTGILAAGTALAVDSQVDFPLRIGALAVLAAVLAGAAVGLGTDEADPAPPRLLRARLLVLLALCVGTGAAATAAAFLAQAEAETVWGPSDVPMAQGDALARDAGDIPRREAKRGRAGDLTDLVQQAEKQYANAVLRTPTRWEPMMRLGLAQRALGQKADALKTLKAATEIYPTLPWAWLGLARALREAGDEPGARDAWRHMLALNLPKDATPYVKEAFATDEDPLVLARAVLPERADRWASAGHVQEKHQQNVQAEAMYREARRINPKAGIELATALFRWGRVDEAEEALGALSETCRGLLLTGDIAFSREDWTGAGAGYERALRVCGARERRARIGLARTRLAQNDLKALAILEALVDEDPSDAGTLRLLIRELGAAGRTGEAAKYRGMVGKRRRRKGLPVEGAEMPQETPQEGVQEGVQEGGDDTAGSEPSVLPSVP